MWKIEVTEALANPSDQQLRRWTCEFRGRGTIWEHLNRRLDEQGISFDTHPQVVDLCAGDGSIAALMVERGWSPRQITNIDLYETSTPLVDGCNWKYLDLGALAWAIECGDSINHEVTRLRHKFNVVTLVQGFLGEEHEESVVNYFLKPGGFSFHI